MFADGHTMICSYSVRTSAMNRSPTPTECTLRLFMYNQCLFHEHVIFTHVHQRLHHVHPLWCVIAFIQFGVNGRDKSAPTPTECMPRIVYVQSMFTPRTRNIYPRTPMFTPRASTVGGDLSCPHITECTVWVFLCFINFVFHLCHSICALMISYFRSVAPTRVATTHWIKID